MLEGNLHIFKVKGHGIGLEEIVADHAREVKAKHVFPRKRSIVQTRDIVFLYDSEGKLMHGVRHDLQLPASPGSFGSFVFLQLDSSFLGNRLRQSARTTKRFPLSRCASAIQIVRPWEPVAETQLQLQPALLRLSAMISQYFILRRAWLLFVEQRG